MSTGKVSQRDIVAALRYQAAHPGAKFGEALVAIGATPQDKVDLLLLWQKALRTQHGQDVRRLAAMAHGIGDV